MANVNTGGPESIMPLLVGRERELATLRAAFDAALAGRGSLMLIGGEAGIGKTTLAEALLREAPDGGAAVLVGRCYDLTETPPYGPWRDLFAHAPAGAPPPIGVSPDSDAGALPNQGALFERVRAFFADLAAPRPVVAFLDDLHWADPASLDLLRFLARELARLPMLLIATYRADELTRRHPLYALLPTLVREGRAERLDLRRLGRDDARALVRAGYALPATDEDRLVAYLQDHAEGNPFYTGELLRMALEEGILRREAGGWMLSDLSRARVPSLLRQVIDGRLERLGDGARDLLAVGAVIGQEVPLALWAAVADTTEETLLPVVERAAEARLLEVAAGDTEMRFAHALVREALYEALLPSRRRLWHRRAAEMLASQSRPDPDAVAAHLQRAGDPRAAEWLVRAGERARRSYALLTAAERFEAALTLLEGQGGAAHERAIVLYRLARMRRYADPRGAIVYLDDAEALAIEADDTLLAAYIVSCRGYLRCTAGTIRRGLDELARGVAAVDARPAEDRARLPGLQESLGDPPDDGHYRGALASWLALAGRYTEARDEAERVVAGETATAAPSAGTSFAANAWRGLASAHAALGRVEEAQRAYERAIDAYRAVGHWYQVGNTRAIELYEVAIPYRADDPAALRRLADDAAEAWALASDVLTDLPLHVAHLPLLLLAGDWDEARDLALAIREPGGRTQWRPFATTYLAQLARDRGDTDLARSLVRERLPDGPTAEPGDAIFLDATPLQRLAAALALDAGDLLLARSWLEAHDRWLTWSGAILGRSEGCALWSRYHRAADDHATARETAKRALAHASEPRQPLALLAAHRLLGELDTAEGHYVEATAHLNAATALATACAASCERALTLIAMTQLRQASGEAATSRESLDEARTILERLGAAPALARIEALADIPVTETERTAATNPAGLSTREIEVLRLVAEGLTDADVAERLYLSPRTVSGHLRSVYNKLGVSSRSAATRFALEHGLA